MLWIQCCRQVEKEISRDERWVGSVERSQGSLILAVSIPDGARFTRTEPPAGTCAQVSVETMPRLRNLVTVTRNVCLRIRTDS